jgi:hypothetical protein
MDTEIPRKTLTLCMKKEEKPKGFMDTKTRPKKLHVCNEERRKTYRVYEYK